MAKFRCGDRLRYGNFDSGSSGCLVRFTSQLDRLLMLTAGHVVLPIFARQGDAITNDAGDVQIGRLYTWTTIDGDPTTDAALIWVDPDLIDPSLGALGVPTGASTAFVGQSIQTAAHPLRGNGQDPTIANVAIDVPNVLAVGPGWPTAPTITYRDQISTSGHFTDGGDSGSIAVDAKLGVIGMVVGDGDDGSGGVSMITPISALLAWESWGGRALELVTSFNAADYVPPSAIAAASAQSAPGRSPAPAAELAQTPQAGGAKQDLDDATMRAVTTAVRPNEIGNASPYQISFAGKGNSGASFGFMQGDLAAGQSIVTTTFNRVLAAAQVPDAKAQSLKATLSKPLIDNPLSSADTNLVDNALDSAAGRALVDQMDQNILQDVCAGVSQCLQAASGSNRTVSLRSTVYVAMWINMSGSPTKLLSWLSGQVVLLGKTSVGPAPMQIDDAAMEAYLQATPYFAVNPGNFAHLQECATAATAG